MEMTSLIVLLAVAPLFDRIRDPQPDDDQREEPEEHHVGAQTETEKITEHAACVLLAVIRRPGPGSDRDGMLHASDLDHITGV
jgi:hypothetical protein